MIYICFRYFEVYDIYDINVMIDMKFGKVQRENVF